MLLLGKRFCITEGPLALFLILRTGLCWKSSKSFIFQTCCACKTVFHVDDAETKDFEHDNRIEPWDMINNQWENYLLMTSQRLEDKIYKTLSLLVIKRMKILTVILQFKELKILQMTVHSSSDSVDEWKHVSFPFFGLFQLSKCSDWILA